MFLVPSKCFLIFCCTTTRKWRLLWIPGLIPWLNSFSDPHRALKTRMCVCVCACKLASEVFQLLSADLLLDKESTLTMCHRHRLKINTHWLELRGERGWECSTGTWTICIVNTKNPFKKCIPFSCKMYSVMVDFNAQYNVYLNLFVSFNIKNAFVQKQYLWCTDQTNASWQLPFSHQMC